MDDLIGGGDVPKDGEGRVDVPPELSALAASVDGIATGGGGGVAAVAGPGLAAEIEDLASLVVMMAATAWPWVPEIWTSKVIAKASLAAEAVCQKHGWLADGVQGGPELMLALSVAVPVIATVERVRSAPGGAAGDSSGGIVVTMGGGG